MAGSDSLRVECDAGAAVSVSPLLFTESDMPGPSLHAIAGGMAAVFTTRCPGQQSENEDSAAIIHLNESKGVLAVADGAGGQPAGARASGIAIQALCDAVRAASATAADLRDAILDGFERASRAVADLGVGARTTLAVVEVAGTSIRPYHAGDSMILVVGQRGKIKLQTVSHSPVGYAVESGLLDEAEALGHAERHVVSNFVGDADMRIEIGSELELSPRDTVLVASDGLFDNLETAEIIDYIRTGTLQRVATRLAATCRARMLTPPQGTVSKPDDLTHIAYRLRR